MTYHLGANVDKFSTLFRQASVSLQFRVKRISNEKRLNIFLTDESNDE